MQDAAFRMAAFAAEIEFAMPGNFALVEMQAELDQLADSRPGLRSRLSARPLRRTDPAPASSVSLHMQLERIFVAGHAGDPALRPGGVACPRLCVS